MFKHTLILTLSICAMALPAYAQPILYITDNGTDRVSSSNLDGTDFQTMVTLTENPRGIAFDSQNQRVYFAVQGPLIQWVDMNGGTPTTILDARDGLQEPIDLVVDGDYLYITDNGTDRVSSSKLDGTDFTTLVTLTENPRGIAFDSQNQRVYFAVQGPLIQWVDMNGGTPTTILKAIDGLQEPIDLAIQGTTPPISIDGDKSGQLPKKFFLEQNYPNPFNPETVIEYTLPTAGKVSLVIYNLRGEEVALLFSGTVHAGNHQVTWDASNVSSGIYFYRLQAGDFVQTRKMLLLK